MKDKRVLSLEDDENLATVMRHYLEDEGMHLIQVSRGADCLSALSENEFDIILMDLGLPDVDGLSLIPQIRQNFQGPIIVISGKTSTTDRVVGLEMGADDYVTKPFEMRELLARIKANVRRQQPANTQSQTNKDDDANTIYSFAGFEYEAAKLSLTYNGHSIELTSGECELLGLFLNSNGRVLSREHIFEQTRGDHFDAYDRAVDIAVTRLRKKLHDDPANSEIIKTVRGVGYMFIAEIDINAPMKKPDAEAGLS